MFHNELQGAHKVTMTHHEHLRVNRNITVNILSINVIRARKRAKWVLALIESTR